MFEYPTPWLFAGLAALLGFAMGGAALVAPRWAQTVVRLMPDPRWKGGFAEFRANYGGALFLLHGAVILTLIMSFQAGAGAVMGSTFAASCYWLGMVIGRAVSMFADAEQDTRTRYNLIGLGFELVMAAALGAPFLSHLGG